MPSGTQHLRRGDRVAGYTRTRDEFIRTQGIGRGLKDREEHLLCVRVRRVMDHRCPRELGLQRELTTPVKVLPKDACLA